MIKNKKSFLPQFSNHFAGLGKKKVEKKKKLRKEIFALIVPGFMRVGLPSKVYHFSKSLITK